MMAEQSHGSKTAESSHLNQKVGGREHAGMGMSLVKHQRPLPETHLL